MVGRLVNSSFREQTKSTIGCDFVSFEAKDEDGELLSVQLWDTGGQERFQNMGCVYYQGAHVVLLCADSLATLARLEFWRKECMSILRGRARPQFIILLTKSDLGVSEELRRCPRMLRLPVMEVSALTGDGASELKEEIASCAPLEARVKKRSQLFNWLSTRFAKCIKLTGSVLVACISLAMLLNIA